MFGHWAVLITSWFLNKNSISLEDRMILTNCVLDKLAALPLRDIIKRNSENILTINGQEVDFEHASKLRESARSALNNYSLDLVYQQVAFNAVEISTFKAESNEQCFFGKSAIWWGQEQKRMLRELAQIDKEELDL